MREQFSPKSSVLNTTCSATKEEEKRFFFFLEEKTWSWKIFAPFLFSSSLSLSFIFYFEKNDRRSRCFSILHRHWTFLLVQLEPFSCFSFPHPLFLSFDPSFSRVSPGVRGMERPRRRRGNTRRKLVVEKWKRRRDFSRSAGDAYDRADAAGQSWPALYDHRTVSISAISVLAVPSSGVLVSNNRFQLSLDSNKIICSGRWIGIRAGREGISWICNGFFFSFFLFFQWSGTL